MRILVGIPTVVLVFVAAYVLFQSLKRKRALHRLATNDSTLRELITLPVLDSAAPEQTHLSRASTNEEFLVIIYALISSDNAAISTMRLLSGLLLSVGLAASYMLGAGWLIACVASVLLASTVPLSGPGARSAVQNLLETALVLDRWRSHDQVACIKFLEQAYTLRPLFDAVEYARRANDA